MKLWVYDGSGCDECYRGATVADVSRWLETHWTALGVTQDGESLLSQVQDYHSSLCALLQLDPSLATADDVLRLVGACVDRATEAERKRCDGCRHWRASLSGDPSGFCNSTESGCIMRPGDHCSRWEERR